MNNRFEPGDVVRDRREGTIGVVIGAICETHCPAGPAYPVHWFGPNPRAEKCAETKEDTWHAEGMDRVEAA